MKKIGTWLQTDILILLSAMPNIHTNASTYNNKAILGWAMYDFANSSFTTLIVTFIYAGLITIFAFGGIYAAGTFNFSFQEIMIFGIVLNITAGLGALIMGFLDDRLGGKKTIQVSLVFLAID